MIAYQNKLLITVFIINNSIPPTTIFWSQGKLNSNWKARHLSISSISKLILSTSSKHQSGIQFYCHILENLQLESNRVDNLEAVYCTMGLLAVEMGCDEIIVDLYRLALDIQVGRTININHITKDHCHVCTNWILAKHV